MFGIKVFDNSDAAQIAHLKQKFATASVHIDSQLRVFHATMFLKQTEIAALEDELDTLDTTLRAESTKLVAATQHLYRVQQLTWWQRVVAAIFKPEGV